MKEILTLKNVQVDCRDLTYKQIYAMAYVFESNGYINSIGLNVCDTYFVLRQRWGKEDNHFGILGDHKEDRFTTITYEKFMELFGNKEKSEECKNLVEVLNEELTEEYNKSTPRDSINLECNPKSEHKLFEAYKESSNKLNYELDFNFITQLAERMAQNKHKYQPYNWQKLDNVSELKQALFRHVLEVMNGNYEDDNRLLGHLESIALNAMFINYQLNKNESYNN